MFQQVTTSGLVLADCSGGGEGDTCSSTGGDDIRTTTQQVNFPDFSLRIVRNHMTRRHPELDAANLEVAESEYRKFLKRCKEAGGKAVVPGHLADKFWHAHILHTKLYMANCIEYFGYYLHHTPKEMDVKEPCTLGECFCDGDAPAGGGIAMERLFKPTESCG